jgi:adenylate cyclase class 2
VDLEVEQKFRVHQFEPIEAELRALGATFHPAVDQCDEYFAHPSRDFAVTDEALRIRRVGPASWITYKGPKLDRTSKTRWECAAHCGELLQALGFRTVAQVHKHRRCAELVWQDLRVEVSLDQVRDLGRFVELEIVADHANFPAAKQSLASLAQRLGLADTERRSYLELLLEMRRSTVILANISLDSHPSP